MTKDKISSQEIIDLVTSKASINRRTTEEFLKAMISTVEEALLGDEIVKIKNFGTFKLQWNEPRKSVNIQTGEEILLAGYYKVIFIPESLLKDLVNEPFAHLEPVDLDDDSDMPIPEEISEFSVQMRIFSEQASEIVDILSEIKELSNNMKTMDSDKQPIEQKQTNNEVKEFEEDEPLTFIEEEVVEKPNQSIRIVSDDLVQPTEKVSDVTAEIKQEEIQAISLTAQANAEETPFSENIEKKSHKIWVWMLLILFVLAGTGTGLYFLYLPVQEFTDSAYLKSKTTILKISENISIPSTLNTVLGWFFYVPVKIPAPQTIIIPKDTTSKDSIKSDSISANLHNLFDSPRVYKEYIGSERIKLNSRLQTIAQQYYGNKVFWVYIYEANKDNIPNPENIPIGTLIKIPKVDSRLIDSKNPYCIQKAKELNDIYMK